MSESFWNSISDKVMEVLKKAHRYNGQRCFLTAYQIAVLVVKNNGGAIPKYNSEGEGSLGGKGEGDHNSFSKYIAGNISRCINQKNNTEWNNVELGFLSTEELKQFSFEDEKKILRTPSSETFSMFRLKDQD